MVTPTRKLFPSVTNRHILPALTSHSILGSSRLRSCSAKRVSADESILQAMNLRTVTMGNTIGRAPDLWSSGGGPSR
jgi:hypothetical protein